jgi:hypothetical protein
VVLETFTIVSFPTTAGTSPGTFPEKYETISRSISVAANIGIALIGIGDEAGDDGVIAGGVSTLGSMKLCSASWG